MGSECAYEQTHFTCNQAFSHFTSRMKGSLNREISCYHLATNLLFWFTGSTFREMKRQAGIKKRALYLNVNKNSLQNLTNHFNKSNEGPEVPGVAYTIPLDYQSIKRNSTSIPVKNTQKSTLTHSVKYIITESQQAKPDFVPTRIST